MVRTKPISIKVQVDGLDSIILEDLKRINQELATEDSSSPTHEQDNAFEMAGFFDNVIRTFDKLCLSEKVIFYGEICLRKLSKMQCDDYSPYASTLYLLGKAYAQTPNDQEVARTHFSKALEFASKQKDYLTGVRVADVIGERELVWQLFEEGLGYYRRDMDPDAEAEICQIMEKILQRQMDEVKKIRFRAEEK